MPINIGPADIQLSVTQALPAAGTNVTTGILDLQAVAPNSNAWRLGRLAIVVPALPENTANTGITIALQAAPPSLTNSPPAPQLPVPGAFVTPATSQTFTIAAIAGTGSPAQIGYFTLAFDASGSTYQFYQFLITTPAGTITVGENITIQWIYDSD
jgi:hypothetical protein